MNKFITISSAFLATAAAVKAQSPNILFILADDLGYGDISAFNPESKIPTPNIDHLTRTGITFTDAHASSALSTPSRYSILTGRYPWRTTLKEGVLDGYSPAMITPGRRTIARMLSENGYSTACIGKWHLGWDWGYAEGAENKKEVDFSLPIENGPVDRGFDYFFGIPSSLDIAPYVYVENNRTTTIPDHVIEPQKGLLLMHGGVAGADFDPRDCLPNLIRHSIDYLNEQKNSRKPFFLYLPLTAPHTPVLPSDEYKGKTRIGAYGDFVVMIDDMVRQIIEALEKNNQLDNTLVIFTSDNGCAPYVGVKEMERQGHFPSYLYRGYKTDIYEGGHRIPLIVSWKGKYRGETNNSLVSLTDFYATFAQLVNHKLEKEEAVDSYSLWPILKKRQTVVRENLVYESGKGYLSLRTPKLKLIFHGGSG
ncbi:MAG: arylsulfatase, partial [Parabacteroides sp.]|nr:arylsulfatase [Parabacteroides sp.]